MQNNYFWECNNAPRKIVWVAQLDRAPARRAADPGSNPGPDENFSLKSTVYKIILYYWVGINSGDI